MLATKRSSSVRPNGTLRCVDRCCFRTRHARRSETFRAGKHDQYRHDDGRGLKVSLCSLGQDQLVQGQVGDSLPEPLIFLLKALQFLQLIRTHSAVLLLTAVVRPFSHTDRVDRSDAAGKGAARLQRMCGRCGWRLTPQSEIAGISPSYRGFLSNFLVVVISGSHASDDCRQSSNLGVRSWRCATVPTRML